jgi:antitoxin HicB
MTQIAYAYPIDLTRDDDGVTVTFPDVPEAITGAATEAGALSLAHDCLATALSGRITDGEAVPRPSTAEGRPLVAPGTVLAAKLGLYDATRERGMSASDLAAALVMREPVVRRMLDPKHATRIDRLEAALAQLGRRVVLAIETA